MTPSDGSDASQDSKPGYGFWALSGFVILMVLAAAYPSVRALVLSVLTLPFRAVGWALPGDSMYADAQWAARIMGWVGWCALAFLWAPMVIVALGGVLKFAPFLQAPGVVWSRLIAGENGRIGQAIAAASATAPAALVAILVASSLLLPWTLSFGVLATLTLLSPVLSSGAEHPIVALVRGGADRIDGATHLLGESVRWAALALVIVVATVVTQRYIFGVTFTKLSELVVYLHAAMFMLMAAATLKADGHVRVDVLYGRMSPRGKAIVNFIGVYLLLAPMCLVILSVSASYVDISWRVSESSTETDGLPLVFLLKTIIPTFAVLMLAQGASLAARSALVIVGVDSGEEPSEHPLHDVL